jgi:hypothetical protein
MGRRARGNFKVVHQLRLGCISPAASLARAGWCYKMEISNLRRIDSNPDHGVKRQVEWAKKKPLGFLRIVEIRPLYYRVSSTMLSSLV